MSYEYDLYLNEHIENVKRGLRWMSENLKLEEYAISIAMDNAMMHDESKTSSAEYRAYDDYFYGGNRSYSVVTKFNYAWLHHIHHNLHHWQYWVLINDDPEEGNVALEMPLPNVYEMIADWWTFSWKNNNLMEIFSWYDSHQEYMILHHKTRQEVEDILKDMMAVLEMQLIKERKPVTIGADYSKDEDWTAYVEHGDISDEEDKKYGVPEQKKFPMPDADHVRSAIKFFNYVDAAHEKELAEAILKRMDEYGMSFDDFGVGDENRFKKYIPKENHLEHHGILGQKWGIRRFQNRDGTRTELGKSRYSKHTVFVSGSSKTQTEDSGYYRKELPKDIQNELDHHIRTGNKIIVGDAPGIDRQVQDYLNSKKYENVEVYGPGKQVRYTANEKWKTNPIDDPDHEEGSKEWLAKKDKAMSDAADEGLAIILDEGAAATRRNVGRLADEGKNISVFQLGKDGLDRWFNEDELLELMETEVDKLYGNNK